MQLVLGSDFNGVGQAVTAPAAARADHRGRGPAHRRRHELHQLMAGHSRPPRPLAAAAAGTAARGARCSPSTTTSTGERTELSATTLANWVAKTANLLQEEFDVGPGSTVARRAAGALADRRGAARRLELRRAVLDTAGEDDDRFAAADVVLAAADRLAAAGGAGRCPS